MKNLSPETSREFPKELKTETAEVKDVPEILRIAEQIKLDPKNPDKEKIGKGFLVYTLSAEQYAARLNEYFTVARTPFERSHGLRGGGKVTGFLMCYDAVFLRDLIASGQITHEDGIMRFLQTIEPDEKYVFGDQIGIDYKQSHKGVGTKLMKDLFEKMKIKRIKKKYVAVLSEPVQNKVSKNFCEGLGANKITEVENSDGLKWGIYRFDLDQAK